MHVASAVVDEFPDGQLYVNLRGVEGPAVAAQPSDVLGEFLRALGVDGANIPVGAREREALYRTRLAGKRILVLLDNAADEAQVRPLLPGDPGCAVIVTSRSPLALDGGHPLSLDLMTEREAIDLLRNILGADRVDAEPAEALEIVRLCGLLPLAVRISGARLAQSPKWSLSRWRSGLADERRRLRKLKVGDLDARASFNLSYDHGLTKEQRRAFDLLGLIGARDFPGWVLGPLLNCGSHDADEILEAMVRAQLLEEISVDGEESRYGFHDLVRDLSREHLEARTDRASAAARLAGAYLSGVASMHKVRDPTGLSTWDDLVMCAAGAVAPEIRLSSDLPNLLDAVDMAAAHAQERCALDLARLIIPLLEVPSLWTEWASLADTGLDLARQLGDRPVQAEMCRHQGEVSIYRGYREAAIGRFTTGLRVLEGSGEARAGAVLLLRLGEALRFVGRTDEALDRMEQGKRIFIDLGDPLGEAYALVSIGGIQRVRMRWDDAVESLTGALRVLREFRHRRQTAIALVSLGDVYHLKALWTEAMECFDECRRLFHDGGDRMWTANTDRHIGIVDFLTGRWIEARSRFTAALEVFTKIGDNRKRALTLWNSGELLIAEGRREEAHACLDEALQIFESMKDRFGLALVLTTVGQLCATEYALGDDLDPQLTRGLVVAQELDHDLLIAMAKLNKAEVLLRQDHPSEAIAMARPALEISRRLGAPRWEANALTLLARAHEQAGDHTTARRLTTESSEVHRRFGLYRATEAARR
ncbi:MAG: tetratricopeptide repeat protein [Dactylosporangium sp.]|nr:tetratricopeptide repeat protein [Dactylosporangium sp.]